MFPENDTQFEEHKITEVEEASDGWHITFEDCGTMYVATCPVIPYVGDTARLYGKVFGGTVRGLFVNCVQFYYRTEIEDKKHQRIMIYGTNAADWLKRWDDGQIVWSIEMGGLGPGYEQAIQITVTEILRFLLQQQYNITDCDWEACRDAVRKHVLATELISQLGLSDAQWGAAFSLAVKLYRYGPCEMLNDKAIADRKIQVSRDFPGNTH